ncbi:hypothetical protein [Paenimyroides baculatum]|uniref:YD repeat-containing protein n=1 Tax=Paenimyroides baculatum TaxID=2608000 RepID=A0A5M6CKS1_9FLAO|nr:hypothetical protein [Paenimyroides baculatum]KAA5535617.1 hypothetical protein F0460_07500 [Paenimyroides baculatum]
MKKFLVFIVFLIWFSLNAQPVPGPGPSLHQLSNSEQVFGKTIATSFKATPDVTAFQVRSINPVNNYTGAIDLEIPIFEIEMDGLKVPISIQYNSKGIKVDDIASCVGMNWNLRAGGNIVRVIRDIPDHKVGWYNYPTLALTSNGGQASMHSPKVGSVGANRRKSNYALPYSYWQVTTDPSRTDYNLAIYTENNDLTNATTLPSGPNYLYSDCNYDEYFINAPSLSDVFILKNSSTTEDPFVSGYNTSNMQAYFRQNLGNKLTNVTPKTVASLGNGFASELNVDHPNLYQNVISHPPLYTGIHHFLAEKRKLKDFFDFEILNDKGFKFTFNNYDVIENFHGNFSDQSLWSSNHVLTNNSLYNNYNKDVASWHLNKINSPYGVKSVEFEYETYNHSAVEKKRQAFSRVKNIKDLPTNDISIKYEEEKGVIFDSGRNWEKIPEKNRIKNIKFSEGKVEFIYAENRLDYAGDSRLSEIKIYNLHGNIIKHVQLNQIYYNTKDGTVGTINHRMFLESVVIKNLADNEQSEVYRFEYNNPERLPQRYSNEQDFLGYFNSNGHTTIGTKTPKLYYYHNLDHPRFLPNILPPQFNHRIIIDGDYSLAPHGNSLYGLLNKVIYPTKGYTTYEYEHDFFKLLNVPIEAGSARIKSQKIYDSNQTLVNEVAYEYPNNEGYMNFMPLLASFKKYIPDPNFELGSIMTYNMPKSGIELTQGSTVGYANVVEKFLKSNIKKEFDFTTPLDYPIERNTINTTNSVSNDVLKHKLPYHFNDQYKGKLKEMRIYDGTILKNKVTNIYKKYKSKEVSLSKTNYFPSFSMGDRMFQYTSNSVYNQEFLALDQSLLVEYEGSQSKTLQKNYTYKTANTIISPVYYPFIATEILKTVNSENKTEYSYPFGSLFVGGAPYPTQLSIDNRLSDPYATTYTTNDKIIKKQSVLFDSFSYNNGSSMWFPRTNISAIQENFMNTVNTDEIIVDYRDEYGNIVTYHTADNIYFTAIWGYKGSYPIVEIKNTKFQDLDITKVNNIRTISDTGSGNEETLINAIMDLKSSLSGNVFLEYKIYKPLVGVTLKGDVNGKRTYYNYDGLNRLIKIYDDNLNIIKEYEYSYE